MHIDDWLNDPNQDIYARFVLTYLRFPAFRQCECPEVRTKYRLFCTYEGKRYRVTMASRFGDIGLIANPNEEWSYLERVEVTECSQWSDELDYREPPKP